MKKQNTQSDTLRGGNAVRQTVTNPDSRYIMKGGVIMPQMTLKAARVNAGLTQTAVAQRLDVSISTIKNWESGKTFPKQPQIEALCRLYGVSYDNIFFA